MAKKKKKTDDVGINMTPMIDMVFQLMIFFLLVSQFASAEIDPRVQLPDIDFEKSVAEETKPEYKLVINLMDDVELDADYSQGVTSAPLDYIKVGTLNITEMGRQDPGGWRGVMEKTVRKEQSRIGEGGQLVVVIRAHRALRWGSVKQVFAKVASLGIANVFMGAPMGEYGLNRE
jgi:biopolymer transport protein ExbD